MRTDTTTTKPKISRTTVKELDKARILQLLAEADTKWVGSHSGQFNYREHLEFTANYIARNYHKETKHGKQDGNSNRKQ